MFAVLLVSTSYVCVCVGVRAGVSTCVWTRPLIWFAPNTRQGLNQTDDRSCSKHLHFPVAVYTYLSFSTLALGAHTQSGQSGTCQNANVGHANRLCITFTYRQYVARRVSKYTEISVWANQAEIIYLHTNIYPLGEKIAELLPFSFSSTDESSSSALTFFT